jgi:hypothetical protein
MGKKTDLFEGRWTRTGVVEVGPAVLLSKRQTSSRAVPRDQEDRPLRGIWPLRGVRGIFGAGPGFGMGKKTGLFEGRWTRTGVVEVGPAELLSKRQTSSRGVWARRQTSSRGVRGGGQKDRPLRGARGGDGPLRWGVVTFRSGARRGGSRGGGLTGWGRGLVWGRVGIMHDSGVEWRWEVRRPEWAVREGWGCDGGRSAEERCQRCDFREP